MLWQLSFLQIKESKLRARISLAMETRLQESSGRPTVVHFKFDARFWETCCVGRLSSNKSKWMNECLFGIVGLLCFFNFCSICLRCFGITICAISITFAMAAIRGNVAQYNGYWEGSCITFALFLAIREGKRLLTLHMCACVFWSCARFVFDVSFFVFLFCFRFQLVPYVLFSVR